MVAAATIYVVDDDTGLRTAYAAALSRLGYQVETAADGAEALKLVAAKGNPKLIVLDMLMPNLDGLGFLKQFRSDGANKDVPVVIVSNFEALPEVGELEVAKFIAKADKGPDEVAASVHELLNPA